MPTFFSRRYMRGRAVPIERVIGAGILVLLAVIVGLFLLTGGLLRGTVERVPLLARVKAVIGIDERPLFVADPGSIPVARPPSVRVAARALTSVPAAATRPGAAGVAGRPGAARFAEVGGEIAAPVKIERYTDNLYEKIDGREGQFRAYHFVELRCGHYVDTRRQRAFEVYIYDMAEPDNAMGIYAAERSAEAAPLGVGREGYLSGGSAYFWKGRYYVNVLGPEEVDEAAAEAARRVAAAVAETIADAGGGFWAETLLPSEERVGGSFKYRATSALGYDFLEHMYLADYEHGSTGYSMFVLKAADAKAAAGLFDKLAEATQKYDQLLSRESSDGGQRLVGESLGVYMAAFQKGSYLGGVVECDHRELAEQRAAALRERVPKE